MNETLQITIELNGEIRTFPAGTTLAAIVADRARDPGSIATAVNGAFVARPVRREHVLNQGDIVLFFAPMVGG